MGALYDNHVKFATARRTPASCTYHERSDAECRPAPPRHSPTSVFFPSGDPSSPLHGGMPATGTNSQSEEASFAALVQGLEGGESQARAVALPVDPPAGPECYADQLCWGAQILGSTAWCTPGFTHGKCHFKCVQGLEHADGAQHHRFSTSPIYAVPLSSLNEPPNE